MSVHPAAIGGRRQNVPEGPQRKRDLSFPGRGPSRSAGTTRGSRPGPDSSRRASPEPGVASERPPELTSAVPLHPSLPRPWHGGLTIYPGRTSGPDSEGGGLSRGHTAKRHLSRKPRAPWSQSARSQNSAHLLASSPLLTPERASRAGVSESCLRCPQHGQVPPGQG